MHRDAGGVDLSEAGISEICTLLIALPCGRTVAVHGVGGKKIGVAISAGGDHYGMGSEPFKLSGNKVSGYDTLCLSVDDDEVKHLVARITLYGTCCNFLVQRSVGTEQKLLAGLSPRIEGTADLHASERSVGEVSAVFTGKRNTLSDALVDDGGAHLSETVNVSLPCTIVTTFDRVIEETVDGIVVVLVVLGCVDTTLCGN